jgi:hypothetical protein
VKTRTSNPTNNCLKKTQLKESHSFKKRAKAIGTDSRNGRGEHGPSSSFLSGTEPRAQDLPVRIAIALELLELL